MAILIKCKVCKGKMYLFRKKEFLFIKCSQCKRDVRYILDMTLSPESDKMKSGEAAERKG